MPNVNEEQPVTNYRKEAFNYAIWGTMHGILACIMVYQGYRLTQKPRESNGPNYTSLGVSEIISSLGFFKSSAQDFRKAFNCVVKHREEQSSQNRHYRIV